jgi:hypothetical protein
VLKVQEAAFARSRPLIMKVVGEMRICREGVVYSCYVSQVSCKLFQTSPLLGLALSPLVMEVLQSLVNAAIMRFSCLSWETCLQYGAKLRWNMDIRA